MPQEVTFCNAKKPKHISSRNATKRNTTSPLGNMSLFSDSSKFKNSPRELDMVYYAAYDDDMNLLELQKKINFRKEWANEFYTLKSEW